MIYNISEINQPRKVARAARKGFTFVELMIGIVVIGIVMGGAVYTGMTILTNIRRNSTTTTLQTLNMAIMNYKAEKGDYPRSLQELLKAGFLKKSVPQDAWNHNFIFRVTPEGKKPYELYSYGPDGKGGTKESRIYAKTN